MSYVVDNAIILAAGTASRFAPISYEKPKALIEVKGEVLIERQIRQLQEAGISEIIVVVGYKKEQFMYLREKYGVVIVENNDYLTRNNNGSIYAVKSYLGNSYICSSDNYFTKNPFELIVDESYYAALYSVGATNEWCMTEDENGYINDVQIGGSDSWYMLGHVFWSQKFSIKFLDILERIYEQPQTKDALWEKIFIANLDDLKMKIRKYDSDSIFEFDTLDELREFDDTYLVNTRSKILKSVAKRLKCEEKDIKEVIAYKDSQNEAVGFRFKCRERQYEYSYCEGTVKEI